MNSTLCALIFANVLLGFKHCRTLEISGQVIVDLTHSIVEGNPRIPIFPDLGRNNSIFNLKGPNNTLRYEDLAIATHYGTHLDAPCHLRGTWCLGNIPLSRLVLVPVVVVDVREKVFPNGEPNSDYQISVQDILNWEQEHQEQLPDDGVVLFYTDWQRFWNEPEKYAGGNTLDTISSPGLSGDASQWIIENRPKLFGVGIDSLSIDYGRSKELPSHNYITSVNMYILENLMNLGSLPITGSKINIAVMKLGDQASGAPARVIALYDAQ